MGEAYVDIASVAAKAQHVLSGGGSGGSGGGDPYRDSISSSSGSSSSSSRGGNISSSGRGHNGGSHGGGNGGWEEWVELRARKGNRRWDLIFPIFNIFNLYTDKIYMYLYLVMKSFIGGAETFSHLSHAETSTMVLLKPTGGIIRITFTQTNYILPSSSFVLTSLFFLRSSSFVLPSSFFLLRSSFFPQ